MATEQHTSQHIPQQAGPRDTGQRSDEVLDWTDLGREMWSFLTGRQAAINYRFIDMAVEVPRDTGPDAPRATWKLNGTLQVTTRDQAADTHEGHDGHRDRI
jgi:hypothetical protein